MRSFNLSEWALTHQSLTRFFLVICLFAGLFSYSKLGQNEDPEFTFRVMVISTQWPGATALELSEQVVDKIERKLQDTPFVDKIRSYAKPGQSLTFVTLKGAVPPKDVQGIWYQVRKKVGDIKTSLPANLQGPFFNDEFGDTYGTIYAFSADGFSYAELKDYVDHARQEFLRVPNVAKADLFGVQDEKIYIELSHQKFSQLGLTITQIVNAINAQNGMEATGVLNGQDETFQIRISGEFKSAEDIEKVVLQVGNQRLHLSDVANIHREFVDPPLTKMRFNGKEVIGLGIVMAKKGDVIQLGKALETAAVRIQAQLPIGIELEKVSDQPKTVDDAVHEFLHSLAEAVVIVLAVSFLSLGLHFKPFRVDARPGLVVAMTIPLVLAVTFFFMWLFDIELQKISLGALIIALGLLVDDAIISVEMMVRKLEEGYDKIAAASYAYKHTAWPMLTGTLVTVAGFLPIGLAKSTTGEYTFSLFAVVGLALVISWVAAVYFTPYLGFLILKPAHEGMHHESDEMYNRSFYQQFRRLVTFCVRYRKTVVAITLLAFVLGIFGFNFIQKQFFPSSNRPELNVELWLPEGSSYQAVEAQALRFEKVLQQMPDVVNYVAYVGDGSPRFYLPLDQQVKQANLAQYIILTKNPEAREAVSKQLAERLPLEFSSIRARINPLQAGPPVPYPVAFRLVGDDPAVLRKLAEEVKAIMRQSPYTMGVNDNWNEMVKGVHFELDQEKARMLGVNTQVLSQAAQLVLSGVTVGQYREGNRSIDMVLRAPSDERTVLSKLAEMSIPTANGRAVPIVQVAKPLMTWEPGVMWRHNRQFSVTVQSDIVEGMQGPYVTELLDPQMNQIRETLPLGYHLDVSGATEESKEGQDSINVNMPIMLVAVLTLLMLQLHSFSRTMLVFITAPLGVIGAAAALLIFRAPFGFVATLGVIALSGMIMRNSVILIDQIEQDISHGSAPWQAIIDSTIRRLRPIMLTAAAAVLAMIPLTRSIFWGPMAIAIMGGLIVATLLTLLFLPALYALWFKVKEPGSIS